MIDGQFMTFEYDTGTSLIDSFATDADANTIRSTDENNNNLKKETALKRHIPVENEFY